MSAQTTRQRPRWPWGVGAVIAIAAIAVAIAIPIALNQTGPTPTTTPDPTATSATPDPGAAPTGCLGGSTRDATMLLAAQAEAPHTTTGAVEVAAALVRWTFRSPLFSTDEAREISDQVISADATPEFRDLETAAGSGVNNSGGVVADGVPFYLSTAPGVWLVESESDDSVTVTIGAAYVVDGVLSPQLRSSSTVEMIWEDGAWRALSGSITRSTEELFELGSDFSGGC